MIVIWGMIGGNGDVYLEGFDNRFRMFINFLGGKGI